MGRFISEDPIEADLNLYRYVANEPMIFRDPDGLDRTGTPTTDPRQLPRKPVKCTFSCSPNTIEERRRMLKEFLKKKREQKQQQQNQNADPNAKKVNQGFSCV